LLLVALMGALIWLVLGSLVWLVFR